MPYTVMNPGWEEWLDEDVTYPVLAAVSKDIADDAGRRAPRDTGDLAGSYIWRRSAKLTIRIGSHLKYGTYMELGTRPHVIVPRIKKALFWDGRIGPKARVYHPGTAPRPHLRPALYTKRALRVVALYA